MPLETSVFVISGTQMILLPADALDVIVGFYR
jgi:hypothetical protein